MASFLSAYRMVSCGALRTASSATQANWRVGRRLVVLGAAPRHGLATSTLRRPSSQRRRPPGGQGAGPDILEAVWTNPFLMRGSMLDKLNRAMCCTALVCAAFWAGQNLDLYYSHPVEALLATSACVFFMAALIAGTLEEEDNAAPRRPVSRRSRASTARPNTVLDVLKGVIAYLDDIAELPFFAAGGMLGLFIRFWVIIAVGSGTLDFVKSIDEFFAHPLEEGAMASVALLYFAAIWRYSYKD